MVQILLALLLRDINALQEKSTGFCVLIYILTCLIMGLAPQRNSA